MKTLRYIFLFIITSSLIIACNDDDDNSEPGNGNGNGNGQEIDPPHIEIHQPENHQTYHLEDTIFIHALFSSEDLHGLHNVNVRLKDRNSDETFMHLHIHAHQNEYEVDTYYIASFENPIDLDLIFDANDHDHRESKIEYMLHVVE